MSAHLERGRLLVQQGRAELGEQELRRALADNPDDANAHALLALALSAQQRLPEALKESRQAVQLAPDWPFTHYVLAHVLDHQDDLKGAHAAISEAIRLDPTDADFLAKLASIHLQRKDWKLALEVAEQGLQCAPEHVTCNNMRATALLKLGRRAEAGATLDV
jgi:tetratricopeptide (TPR) repeat protein